MLSEIIINSFGGEQATPTLFSFSKENKRVFVNKNHYFRNNNEEEVKRKGKPNHEFDKNQEKLELSLLMCAGVCKKRTRRGLC